MGFVERIIYIIETIQPVIKTRKPNTDFTDLWDF